MAAEEEALRAQSGSKRGGARTGEKQ
jgi:hypothetical protein